MMFPLFYKLVIIIILGVYSQVSLAQDVIYKWKDEAGVLHYTDDPANIPQKFKNQVESKTVEKRLPPSPSAPPAKAEESVSTSVAEKKPLEKQGETGAITDNQGRDKQWWLEKKKYWEDEVKRLKAQIEKNNKDILTMRFKKPRQGKRTDEGIILGEGTLIDYNKELIRLKRITPELEERLKKAQYMRAEGLIQQAKRSGVPGEWIEELKSK